MLQADVCQALSCEAAALLGGHPPEVQAARQLLLEVPPEQFAACLADL